MSSLYGDSRCVLLPIMQLSMLFSKSKPLRFVNYVAARAIDKENASFVISLVQREEIYPRILSSHSIIGDISNQKANDDRLWH